MRHTWTILIFIYLTACSGDKGTRDYRDEMRQFVQNISIYARAINPGFIIVPQNGIELITETGNANGPISEYYFQTVTAFAQEDVFFGYVADNQPTPPKIRDELIRFLDRIRNEGKPVLVIDYCSSTPNIDSSYVWNERRSYISFAAPSRELDRIPFYPVMPYNYHSNSVKYMSAAKNFLYLINPDEFPTRQAYLDSLRRTDYDVLILDLFYKDSILTMNDLEMIKNKPSGVPRRLLGYMSIGEAEDYRYYWKPEWKHHPPSWLATENPDWPGNYKVRYWNPQWQSIIYGNDQSYVKKIIDAGFYGAYLDIIDAFEWFERND